MSEEWPDALYDENEWPDLIRKPGFYGSGGAVYIDGLYLGECDEFELELSSDALTTDIIPAGDLPLTKGAQMTPETKTTAAPNAEGRSTSASTNPPSTNPPSTNPPSTNQQPPAESTPPAEYTATGKEFTAWFNDKVRQLTNPTITLGTKTATAVKLHPDGRLECALHGEGSAEAQHFVAFNAQYLEQLMRKIAAIGL